jgi:S1-C subfamily serine protease
MSKLEVIPALRLTNTGEAGEPLYVQNRTGAIRLLFLLGIFSLSGLSASGQDCARIASSYRGAVVSITVDVKETTTGKILDVRNGTGFIITSNGILLTADHIVDIDPALYNVTIKGSAGSLHRYKSPLELIGKSKERDIALLKFLDDSSIYKTVPLGDPWAVRPGQELCSLGFPAPQDQQLGQGTLSSINGRNSMWVTSMPWSKGEDGGPVFDLATSRVVAMQIGTDDKVNYLIPINLARSLIEDYTRLRLPASDAQQDRPPVLLCVENPADTRNSVDTTVEAECEGLNKKTAHSSSWKRPSASTRVDGVSASAEAAIELTCDTSPQGDYVLGLTARHSSMAGVGGASDDYRPSVSSIKGAAVTGFTVERGNYCLVLTQYERDGERKKGYLESEYFPEGPTRPTLIVLESPTGTLIKLKSGISIPLDATGFWRFKIDINSAHSSGSREDSGLITMENLLRFKFSSRTQGGECPSPGDDTHSK